jgi:hypothetical protein
MLASAAKFEAKLGEIIAYERAEAVSNLARGGPEDFAAYREVVGFIRALDQFPDWCTEAAKAAEEM